MSYFKFGTRVTVRQVFQEKNSWMIGKQAVIVRHSPVRSSDRILCYKVAFDDHPCTFVVSCDHLVEYDGPITVVAATAARTTGAVAALVKKNTNVIPFPSRSKR